MPGIYEIWLTDDKGTRLANSRGETLLTNFLYLQATCVVSNIGSFTLRLPINFDTSLAKIDNMIQVWRAPQASRLSLWRVYFIRRRTFSTQGAQEIIELGGSDVNDLLRRRIIAAYSGTTQSEKTDFADDMMKEIVTEALADGVAPAPDAGTRVWNDLTVQGDSSSGPTLTKSFQYERLLLPSGGGALTDIAKASREAGTEVFFDIVPNNISPIAIDFEFRTYTGQPGVDRTVAGVTFDQQKGNMGSPSLIEDYTEEVNYVYSGGQGEGLLRNVRQVYDANRYGVSQWNRCEGFADARDEGTNDGVDAVGNDALSLGRPIRRFSMTPLDIEGSIFGKDWDVGDKVRARYRNEEFDSLVRGATLTVEGGRESISAITDFI